MMFLNPLFLLAQNKPLIRYINISPSGQYLSFSYQGDIWVSEIDGGRPYRLTVHEGYEGKNIWSPDGEHIAFSASRYGNDDIFRIPITGGKAERLTYHSSNDEVSGWTTDNKILFGAQRLFGYVEWERGTYAIEATGGTPTRLLDAVGYNVIKSPDTDWYAFETGPCRVERETYKGSANKDIWLYHSKRKTFHQFTDFEGQDYLPKWGKDGMLYFLSARSGRYNVWTQKVKEDGTVEGTAQQLTFQEDFGVRHFGISDNGILVYTAGDEIYSLNVKTGEQKEVFIPLQTDERFDEVVRKTYRANIEEYALAPNSDLSAFMIRGEVFVKRNYKDDSRAVNLSNSAYRDQDMTWVNDSTVLFVSDRNGNQDIYLSRSSDKQIGGIFESLKHELVQLTDTKEQEHSLKMSPDGKHLLYQRGKGTLLVAEVSDNGKLKNEKVMVDNGWTSFYGVNWSPDSKWVAYSIPDLNFNSEVFIQSVENKEQKANVSMHPRGDVNPVWSPDGSKLAFLSVRNNGDYDIWFAWLKKEDWEKTQQEWKEEDWVPSSESKKKEKEEETVAPITIDLQDIHERLVQVTAYPGEEGSPLFSKDGKTIYFLKNNPIGESTELYKINWDGEEAKSITKGKGIKDVQLSTDGKSLFFLQSGKLQQLTIKSSKKESLKHEAKMLIDYPEEHKQMFEEGWSAINEGFYDPEFHGKDWKALKEKYQPLVLNASTPRDFRYAFNLMLGELNASHMGLYRNEERAQTQRERTGRLGIEVKPHKRGVEVTHVVEGTPAFRQKSKLEVGDVITAVNGHTIDPKANFYQTLANQSAEKVLLTIQGVNGKTKEVVIRPVSYIGEKLYEEWVKEKRRLVEEYSEGRLGYLHIEGMNWTSFERFERELTAAGQGKEGIVIDVRYNGGGWTTDYLMAVLNVKQHAYTIPRGATNSLKNHQDFASNYPYGERLPLSAWTSPAIALCNESSYSNAEIFSHAFKGLNRGLLVGKPTFGAVISTGGHRMIDGALLRMPFRAWYAKQTQLNQELNGAVPDIIVENAPDAYVKKQDAQLKRAVEELLKQVNKK
ncbi:S41 family peptidase [Algivirga pacifica]|uniref:Tricorn protease homolog n=2 Tax=Algivirga pacifica TaxID=1162670 RepID=A0ABP9D6G5_9BACT